MTSDRFERSATPAQEEPIKLAEKTVSKEVPLTWLDVAT